MSNFESRVKQPWTTYDNQLIQQKTIFKNANQKMCYLYLVSFANCSKIFPSIPAIADAICATTRTAMTIIEQLEGIGMIEVKRTPGLPNEYILNDYFEVAATREKISPVKNLHETSEKISPEPVKNFHPKTNNLKLKDKNKNSLDLEAVAHINSDFQESNKNIPVNELADKLLKDIKEGKVKASTDKQYKGLLKKRIEFHIREKEKTKTNNKSSKISNNKPIRTELLPDFYDEHQKNAAKYTGRKLTQEEDAEAEEYLKKITGKI